MAKRVNHKATGGYADVVTVFNRGQIVWPKTSLVSRIMHAESLTSGSAMQTSTERKDYTRGARACMFTQAELESMEEFDLAVDSILNNKTLSAWKKRQLLERLAAQTEALSG